MENGCSDVAAYIYASALYDLRRQPITEYEPMSERLSLHYRYHGRSPDERNLVHQMKYMSHREHLYQHSPIGRTPVEGLVKFKRDGKDRCGP